MMKIRSIIRAHDDEAAQYDQQVQQYEYHVNDVLFGMSFEYIKANDRLLDIGIGTGLASLPFAKAGLEIFGFDGSTEMLKICESKSFAKELKTFDLRDTPFPYSEGYFNHVISSGVWRVERSRERGFAYSQTGRYLCVHCCGQETCGR